MKMKFAVGTGRNEHIHEIAGIALTAEESGFSYLTFLDSQNVSRDIYAMLTIAAVNTRSIKLGHGVTVSVTRHPSVTANATATIDELSGGRAFVGMGAGWSAVWTMGQKPAPLKDVRETVEFIKRYTAGKEAEYKGARMRSEWIGRPLKVYIGGGGPRMLELAGEIADGVIMSSNFGVNPIAMEWKLEHIRRGAEKAGRDPATVDVWARAMMYLADTTEEALKEVSGYAVNSALSTIMQFKRSSPAIEELRQRMERAYPWLMEDCQKVYDAYEPYMHERFDTPAAQLVTRRLIDIYHMAGTAEDIVEKVEAMGKLGISTVATTLYTIIDKNGMMRRIGDEIIPRFRS